MSYSVRFNRGNRDWTCSVFPLRADGTVAGPSVVTATGQTKDKARDLALTLTEDPAIRAALMSADNSRPYWTQGALGEQQEARRLAEASETTDRKRHKK